MNELILMYGLYIVYYLVFPLGFIILIWKIIEKRNYIEDLSDYGEERTKKNLETIEKNSKTLKKLQISLVIFILLFIPVINFTTYGLQEVTIKRDRIPLGTFRSRVYNPVRTTNGQIGPSTDVDSVLQEMEDAPEHRPWYFEDINEEIDFDELTRFPGRLAAYYLEKRDTGMEHIVITYTYFSPLPITRVYAFDVFIWEGGEEADLAEEKTIIYPLDPAGIDPF